MGAWGLTTEAPSPTLAPMENETASVTTRLRFRVFRENLTVFGIFLACVSEFAARDDFVSGLVSSIAIAA